MPCCAVIGPPPLLLMKYLLVGEVHRGEYFNLSGTWISVTDGIWTGGKTNCPRQLFIEGTHKSKVKYT